MTLASTYHSWLSYFPVIAAAVIPWMRGDGQSDGFCLIGVSNTVAGILVFSGDGVANVSRL